MDWLLDEKPKCVQYNAVQFFIFLRYLSISPSFQPQRWRSEQEAVDLSQQVSSKEAPATAERAYLPPFVKNEECENENTLPKSLPSPFVLVWRSFQGFAPLPPSPPPICVFHHVLLLLPSLVMKEWEWKTKKCDICWRCVRNIEWFDPTPSCQFYPLLPPLPPSNVLRVRRSSVVYIDIMVYLLPLLSLFAALRFAWGYGGVSFPPSSSSSPTCVLASPVLFYQMILKFLTWRALLHTPPSPLGTISSPFPPCDKNSDPLELGLKEESLEKRSPVDTRFDLRHVCSMLCESNLLT